jgi:hypothetical protein
MKKTLWIAGLLALPAALFAGDIQIRFGGGGGCAPVNCWPGPIFYPPYSYYGYAAYYPYYYVGSPIGYSSVGSSSSGLGRTIRLGEEHDAFWEKHGGLEPASYSTAETQPLVELTSVDRRSPLEVGDSEGRIRDLDLGVDKIIASGGVTVYFLADGRTVRTEQGVVLEIARR